MLNKELSGISFKCAFMLLTVTSVAMLFWFCLLASFIPCAILFTNIVFTKNTEIMVLVALWVFLLHKRGKGWH